MRILALTANGLALALALSACDDGGGGGSGGSAGASTGGSSGASTGGSGGTGGTGGSAGSSAGGSGGGSGGSAGCSVLSWNHCAPLDECMLANCGTQIEACYGPNYANDDATGSICESLWSCSQTCTCHDNNCLITTCYTGASAACQGCIPPISQCLADNCQAEADACPTP